MLLMCDLHWWPKGKLTQGAIQARTATGYIQQTALQRLGEESK